MVSRLMANREARAKSLHLCKSTSSTGRKYFSRTVKNSSARFAIIPRRNTGNEAATIGSSRCGAKTASEQIVIWKLWKLYISCIYSVDGSWVSTCLPPKKYRATSKEGEMVTWSCRGIRTQGQINRTGDSFDFPPTFHNRTIACGNNPLAGTVLEIPF